MSPIQGAIWIRRLPSAWWCVLITLLILLIAGLVVAAVARRERSVTTWYACIQNGQISSTATSRPHTCSGGTIVVYDEISVHGPVHAVSGRLTSQVRRYLTIPDVMIALSIGTVIWVVAGWNLQGMWILAGWVAVPVGMFAAAVCIAGPGHWFPKEPYEGPSMIPIGSTDAITVLDLVGFAIAIATLLLATMLVMYRYEQQAEPIVN